jgi:hypothetical protein
MPSFQVFARANCRSTPVLVVGSVLVNLKKLAYLVGSMHSPNAAFGRDTKLGNVFFGRLNSGFRPFDTIGVMYKAKKKLRLRMQS